MSTAKMAIEGLDLYYGQFHALKDMSLDIYANEITAFIGPSGCGKSTLLKSLNRMNDLVEGCKITGKVTLDDKDIYRDIQNNIEEERRKKVRREKFIQTEKELRKGRAAELLNVLRNPGPECTPQQYLTAADELERVLTDIRRNCRNV